MDARKLAAEAIGTFWLTFGGCGSAVISVGFPHLGIGFLGGAGFRPYSGNNGLCDWPCVRLPSQSCSDCRPDVRWSNFRLSMWLLTLSLK